MKVTISRSIFAILSLILIAGAAQAAPICARNAQEARNSPEISRALRGRNMFTKWEGRTNSGDPAKLEITEDGRGLFTHPSLRTPFPVQIHICLDDAGKLHVSVPTLSFLPSFAKLPFDSDDLNSITIASGSLSVRLARSAQ